MSIGNRLFRELVWHKYDHHCAYCGCDLEYVDMQIDHIHPRVRGGQDTFENYNPACLYCNLHKSTLTLNEYRIRCQREQFYFETVESTCGQ